MVVKFKLQQFLRVGLLISASFIALPNSVAAAEIIYQNALSNTLGDATASNGACFPYSLTFSDPLGGSAKPLRIEQRGDEACLQYGGTYKHRSMLQIGGVLSPDKVRFEMGVEYWVGYRIFVPSNYPTASDGTMISEMIEAGKSGETGVWTRGTEFRFSRRYVDEGGTLREVHKFVTMPRGQWSSIAYRFKRSLTNTGYVEFWLNGKKVTDTSWLNVRTATDYAALGAKDPFMHLGIYWGTDHRPDDYILHFENLKIAKGSNGYDLVVGNQAAAELTPPPAPSGLQLKVMQ